MAFLWWQGWVTRHFVKEVKPRRKDGGENKKKVNSEAEKGSKEGNDHHPWYTRILWVERRLSWLMKG